MMESPGEPHGTHFRERTGGRIIGHKEEMHRNNVERLPKF